MSLPLRVTPDDVRKIVNYLRTKPTGAAPKDMKAALSSALADSRKIAGVVDWEFVEREGEKYKLAKRGREMARASDAGKQAFLEVAKSTAPYRAALEWAFHEDRSSIDAIDVAARWQEHFNSQIGSDDDTVLRQIASFLQVAEAAGLGTYVPGRRGNPSRIDLDRSALGQMVAEAGIEGPSPEADSIDEGQLTKDRNKEEDNGALDEKESPPEEDRKRSKIDQVTPRVFISHGRNMGIVDQIKTMLDLADLEYEIAVEAEETAIPVPEKVFSAMRRCTAGVICVTADDDMRREDGSYTVNENVLIEIGAAFVLYEKRVVLVWDRRIAVPSNLQGLYRSEFEGEDLSWGAGMKLMKAVGKFKRTGGD